MSILKRQMITTTNGLDEKANKSLLRGNVASRLEVVATPPRVAQGGFIRAAVRGTISMNAGLEE